MARDAVPQAQELPQERFLDRAEQRHVRAILAAGQSGAERDQQQFMQIMAGIILPSYGGHYPAEGQRPRQSRRRILPWQGLNAESAFRVQPRLPQQPPSSTTSAICDRPAGRRLTRGALCRFGVSLYGAFGVKP